MPYLCHAILSSIYLCMNEPRTKLSYPVTRSLFAVFSKNMYLLRNMNKLVKKASRISIQLASVQPGCCYSYDTGIAKLPERTSSLTCLGFTAELSRLTNS